MSAPATVLQEAVFAALSDDSALAALLRATPAHDQQFANAAFPHVTFGRTGVFDWDTGKERPAEQLFTLHVWSKAKGEEETREIMSRAQTLLEGKTLPLDGTGNVTMRLEFAEARQDEDLAIYHGMLRFRATVEEAVGQ